MSTRIQSEAHFLHLLRFLVERDVTSAEKDRRKQPSDGVSARSRLGESPRSSSSLSSSAHQPPPTTSQHAFLQGPNSFRRSRISPRCLSRFVRLSSSPFSLARILTSSPSFLRHSQPSFPTPPQPTTSSLSFVVKQPPSGVWRSLRPAKQDAKRPYPSTMTVRPTTSMDASKSAGRGCWTSFTVA